MKIISYIINLEYRIDRKYVMLSNLFTMGWDLKHVLIYKGKNGADYENEEAMKEAMKQDLSFSQDIVLQGQGQIGCSWSKISAVNNFLQSPYDFMYLSDDDRLSFVRYNFLQKCISDLYKTDPFFLIFNLAVFSDTNAAQIVDDVRKGVDPPYQDTGVVFSKFGAAAILGECKKRGQSIRKIIKDLDHDNCYSLIEKNKIVAFPKEYQHFQESDRLYINRTGKTQGEV